MAKKKKVQWDGIVYSTDTQYVFEAADDESVSATLAPEKQRLYVSLDKKQRAGKMMTIVSGFVGRSEDLNVLGKTLKQQCGVGGTVKDGEILIQGDFVQRIMDTLSRKGYAVKRTGG